MMTPGQALLGSIQSAVPPELRRKFASFVDRNRASLTERLDQWILDDAIEQSRRAYPDFVLFGDKRWEHEKLLLPLMGNYWAMDAVVRRASARGPRCRAEVVDMIAHYGTRELYLDHEVAAIAAVVGKPRKGWVRPPYARTGPIDGSEESLRTLDRRILTALARVPARAAPSLHRDVGGSLPRVRNALTRLVRQRKVYSHSLWNHKKVQERAQHDPELWDLTDMMSTLPRDEYDHLVLRALNEHAKLTESKIRAKEKEIPDRLFEVQGLHQTAHLIPNAVVVEHIGRTRGEERRKIEDTLRSLDLANGDINHFLKHLAEALARSYDWADDYEDGHLHSVRARE